MRPSIAANALLVVWFVATVALAQTWEPLDPQPQSNTLWKVDFVDANHGWACGENGTILHTPDGGSTWEAQTSGTDLGVVNIRFVDMQNGWAVCGSTGLGGAILHTTNGGATWTTQVSGTTYSFFTPLSALSPLECWTADGYCDLMHTNDGGSTWTSRNICETTSWPGGWIYGVSFVDVDHGWIVGGGGTPNAILHTTDGGSSWSLQTGPTDGEFNGIISVDAQNSWIWGAGWWGNSSGGFICHTTNGGDTWTLQQSDKLYNLHELFFLDTTRGWGVGSDGTIVHTTDGGDSWAVEQTSTTLFLHGVHFSDARNGWAVGDGGVMLRYVPDATSVRDGVTPPRFLLAQNHPNPFNPQTTIAFELPEQGAVTLRVFDLGGRLVRTLVNDEVQTPGHHETVWNGRDDAGRQVASGTYFYRLEAGGYSETKRMVLVK